MRTTTDGIVIGTANYDNSDRLLTILSAELGVIRAYARGARKPGSRMCSSTELLSYSRFVLFSHRERTQVDAADVNHLFWHVREDVEKLALASYLCELSAETSPSHEELPEGGAREQLRLLLNCLHMLDTGKRTVSLIKPLFELRQLSMAGYMPDLVGCSRCGCFESDEFHFYPVWGELRCAACDVQDSARSDQYVSLNPAVLTAMRHIIYAQIEKLFQFTLSEECLVQLNSVCERYMLAQLSRSFSSLEFFRQVRGPLGQTERISS